MADMADARRVFERFAAADREGGPAPDPSPYLDQVQGPERERLVALIDAHLAAAGRRPADPESPPSVAAAKLADGLERSLEIGSAGMWPSLLPRLRDRARLRRSELVDRLAAALGVRGAETQVGLYYHEMEQGLLAPDGVSDTVLVALGRIVGESAEALREAGRALGPGGVAASADAPAFARTRPGSEPDPGDPAPRAPGDSDEWDEVDRLFRGG